jgi:hypothetical protein
MSVVAVNDIAGLKNALADSDVTTITLVGSGPFVLDDVVNIDVDKTIIGNSNTLTTDSTVVGVDVGIRVNSVSLTISGTNLVSDQAILIIDNTGVAGSNSITINSCTIDGNRPLVGAQTLPIVVSNSVIKTMLAGYQGNTITVTRSAFTSSTPLVDSVFQSAATKLYHCYWTGASFTANVNSYATFPFEAVGCYFNSPNMITSDFDIGSFTARFDSCFFVGTPSLPNAFQYASVTISRSYLDRTPSFATALYDVVIGDNSALPSPAICTRVNIGNGSVTGRIPDGKRFGTVLSVLNMAGTSSTACATFDSSYWAITGSTTLIEPAGYRDWITPTPQDVVAFVGAADVVGNTDDVLDCASWDDVARLGLNPDMTIGITASFDIGYPLDMNGAKLIRSSSEPVTLWSRSGTAPIKGEVHIDGVNVANDLAAHPSRMLVSSGYGTISNSVITLKGGWSFFEAPSDVVTFNNCVFVITDAAGSAALPVRVVNTAASDVVFNNSGLSQVGAADSALVGSSTAKITVSKGIFTGTGFKIADSMKDAEITRVRLVTPGAICTSSSGLVRISDLQMNGIGSNSSLLGNVSGTALLAFGIYYSDGFATTTTPVVSSGNGSVSVYDFVFPIPPMVRPQETYYRCDVVQPLDYLPDGSHHDHDTINSVPNYTEQADWLEAALGFWDMAGTHPTPTLNEEGVGPLPSIPDLIPYRSPKPATFPPASAWDDFVLHLADTHTADFHVMGDLTATSPAVLRPGVRIHGESVDGQSKSTITDSTGTGIFVTTGGAVAINNLILSPTTATAPLSSVVTRVASLPSPLITGTGSLQLYNTKVTGGSISASLLTTTRCTLNGVTVSGPSKHSRGVLNMLMSDSRVTMATCVANTVRCPVVSASRCQLTGVHQFTSPTAGGTFVDCFFKDPPANFQGLPHRLTRCYFDFSVTPGNETFVDCVDSNPASDGSHGVHNISELADLVANGSWSSAWVLVSSRSARDYETSSQAVGASSQGANTTLQLADFNSPVGAQDSPLEAPCFFANTPVLTPSGWIQIASLKAGDLVVNGRGSHSRVTRVQRTSLRGHIDRVQHPIILRANALGDRVPLTNVVMSRFHKFRYGDRMVNCSQLIEEGDPAVARMEDLAFHSFDSIEYYNLALAGDFIAAGMRVESLSH